MSTLATMFSSEDYRAHPIPNGLVALMGRRACNLFHDYILTQFAESGITQAELARRSGRSAAQINRWLSSPHNWTIDTAGVLFFAITGKEFVLDGKKPFEQPAINYNALLDAPDFERDRLAVPLVIAAE
ncbi:MAG: helix-turn-helix domain-containing protein [Rhodospirillaceae bacterium]|nr:helix-turn-helix domain-containing protein [Rhodospirillaceae bacterium]